MLSLLTAEKDGLQRQQDTVPTAEEKLDKERKSMNSALLYATAKQRINDFCQREYEGQAVFTDMSKINIAYTTTEDARFEVQAYIDLIINLAIK